MVKIRFLGSVATKKDKKHRVKDEEITVFYNFAVERTLFKPNRYSPLTIKKKVSLLINKLLMISYLLKRMNCDLAVGISFSFFIQREMKYVNDEPDQKLIFLVHCDSVSIKLEGKYINTENLKFYSITLHKEKFFNYLYSLLNYLPETVIKGIEEEITIIYNNLKKRM
jgi:hypothetical protein